MAFEGEIARWCGPYDFKNTWAITVSGDGINVCGHMLLNVGGCGSRGMYFHAVGRPKGTPGYAHAGFRWYPLMMNQAQYSRYRIECKKIEWRRMRVNLPNPDAAARKLEELLTKMWTWAVLPHNCVAFVETVIRAGGSGDWWMRCPALDGKDPWVIAR